MKFTDTDRLNALEQIGNASIWHGQWADHVKDKDGQPIVEICEADEDCLPAQEVARGASLREALDMLIAGRSNVKDQAKEAAGADSSPSPCWHWIKSAITAGGVMTISSPMPGKAYFRATMNWKGEDPVSGKMHMDPLEAMTSLNQALMEDAADEMAENGDV